jgi:hypothetical protein
VDINKLIIIFTSRNKKSKIARAIPKEDKAGGLILYDIETYNEASLIKVM